MAQRRMFSNKVIDTDTFLDMPSSSQLLYFHLSMRADDDGFISAPKRIARMIGCGDDDMKLLIAKQFVLPFESGVCVIKHWRVHNYIRSDRYTETMYKYEKSMLCLDNGTYNLNTECTPNVIPSGYQVSHQMDTQVRLGKVRLELGKDSIGNEDEKVSKDTLSSKELTTIMDAWNNLNLSKVIAIKNTRLKLLKARVNEYGLDQVLVTIENIRESNFLQGQNQRNWVITFDWLVKPNNFIKVLENNYNDKKEVITQSITHGKKDEYAHDMGKIRKQLLGIEE